MKKTFRSILAGALALMAVSCYDDSKLLDEIGGVKDGLSDLKAQFEEFKTQINGQVSALQTSYTALNASFTEYKGLNDTQVAALNTALDALRGKIEGESGIQSQVTSVLAQLDAYKAANNANWTTAEAALAALQEKDSQLAASIQSLGTSLGLKDEEILASLTEVAESIVITDVKEENGNVVLTLKNGNTLTVSKDNVVKVVDGKWVAVAADGSEVELGLPITQENLMFNIDWETGMLQYSVDGLPSWDWEKEWIDTDVYVSGNTQGYGIISKAEIYEGSAYLTIDGEDYQFLMMDESTSLEIRSGKTMFAAGQTKEFDIKAIGLSDVYVMSKPEGWRASVNGAKLSVTAPVAENTYAEQEGLVLLHGTTASGLCKVAKLLVTTSTQGLEVSVDVATGAVVVKNGLLMESGIGGMEPLSDNASYSFAPFYFGMVDVEMWEMYGPEMLFQQEQAYSAYDFFFQQGAYGPDYTMDVLNSSIDELYVRLNDPYGVLELEGAPEGSSFVLFAAPMNMDSGRYEAVMDGLVYAYYNPMSVSFEELYKSYNDVLLSVTRIGADYYYVASGRAEEIEPGVYDTGMESSFMYWQMGYMPELGLKAESVSKQRIALSEYASQGETSPLLPGTTYYAFAIPITEGRPKSDYTYENDFLPYVRYFTTNPLVQGGSASVTLAGVDEATTFNTITATITPSAEAETIYYSFVTQTIVDSFENDEAAVAYLVKNGHLVLADGEFTVSQSSLKQNTEKILLAVAVDSEGAYTGTVELALSTKSNPVDPTISVSVESVTWVDVDGEKKPSVVFNVTGAEYLITLGSFKDPNTSNSTNTATFENNLLTSVEGTYVVYFPVVDGKVTILYESYSDYMHNTFVSGLNMNSSKAVVGYSSPQVIDLTEYLPAAEPEEPAEPAE